MSVKRVVHGTHRAADLDDTARLARRCFERVGITRIADVTGLDRIGIPVMAAYRPSSWSLVVSMGKGVSPTAAWVSAAMESIELWHAERPSAPVVHDTAAGLGPDAVCDWAGLPAVPGVATEPTTALDWMPACSLADGAERYVPAEAVHTDGRVPGPPGGRFLCTSNGLASGNTTAEAQLHGLCEVIERDATTLWRAAAAGAGAVDPATIDDVAVAGLLGRVEAVGLRAIVHDMTSDIGVAAVHCTVFDPDPAPGALAEATSGMGCHPSRDVATAARAVTEAAESRLALISGARDDLFRDRYRPVDQRDGRDRLAHLDAAWRDAGRRGCCYRSIPDQWHDTLEADVDAVVAALARRGLDALWVDLSAVDVGVAVGRAVVPGMEMLDEVAGYAPGRRAMGGPMTTPPVVFVGPTIAVDEARAVLDAEYLPPVQLGDVWRISQELPPAIGIIDGLFHQVPAVWHKEILYAMSRGIRVYGAASMGALRAAELAPHGMIAVGEIAAAYQSGALIADDEVVLAHAAAEHGYRPFSEPTVTVRATLARAVEDSVIDAADAAAVLGATVAATYPERRWPALVGAAGVPGDVAARLLAWLPAGRVDVKRRDAIALLEGIGRDLAAAAGPADHAEFVATQLWDELVRRETPLDAILEEVLLEPVLPDQVGRAIAAARAGSPVDWLGTLSALPSWSRHCARARRKAAALAATAQGAGGDDEPCADELLGWLFDTVLGWPDDLRGFLAAVGWDDADAVVAVAAREARYRDATSDPSR